METNNIQQNEQKSNFLTVADQIKRKSHRNSVLFTQEIDFSPKKQNQQYNEVQLSEFTAEKERLISQMDRLEKIDKVKPMNQLTIKQHQRDELRLNNERVKYHLENHRDRMIKLKQQAAEFEDLIEKQRFIDLQQNNKASYFKQLDSKRETQFESKLKNNFFKFQAQEHEEDKALKSKRDSIFKKQLESVNEEERIYDRKKSIRKLKRQIGVDLDRDTPKNLIEFNANDFRFLQQTQKKNLKFAVEDLQQAKQKEFRSEMKLRDSLQLKWNRVKRKIIMLSRMKLVFDEVKLYGTSFRVETSEKRKEVITEFETLLQQPNFSGFENSRKKLNIGWLIILPNSRIRVYWTFVLMVLFFYTSFITPYRLTFIDQDNSSWRIIEYIIDALFLFDMALTFNQAYYNDYGELITTRCQITINYLKSWFIIDLLSIFPFDLMPYGQNNDNADLNGVDDYFRLARLPRLYRLIRMARIIKMIKKVEKNKYAERVGDLLKINAGILRIIIFLFTVIISVHISGCLWFYAAKVKNFQPNTWVFEKGYTESDDFTIYIAAIYWSVQTLATVGFGDITPYNDQRIVCLIWQILGVGFYSFTVGSLSSVLGALDTKQAHLENRITVMDEFCDETNLSKETRTKIRRSLSYAAQKNVFSKDQRDSFLQQIPLHLRYKVAQSMFEGLSKKLQFFQQKEPIFLAYFVPLLSPMRIFQGELIYQKGEHPNLIYFLIKGRVNMVIGLHQITFKTYVQGAYFGEVEILDSSPRLHTARTEVECELLTMPAGEFLRILSFFPAYDDEVKRVALEKLRRENEAIQKMQAIANLGYKSEFWRKQRTASLYQAVKERQEVALSKKSSSSDQSLRTPMHIKKKMAERASIAMIPIEYHRSLIPKKKGKDNANMIYSESFRLPKHAQRRRSENQSMIEVKVSQYISEEEKEESKMSEQLSQPDYLTFSERLLQVPKSRVAVLTRSEEEISDNYFKKQEKEQDNLESQLNDLIEIVSQMKTEKIKGQEIQIQKEEIIKQYNDMQTQTSFDMVTKEVQTDLKTLEWDTLLNDLDGFENKIK